MDDPQAQAGDLQRLVPASLKSNHKAESRLLANVTTGKMADCSDIDDKGIDPKHADDWTDDRRIDAKLLAWLCTNEQARKHIHQHGIQVSGADVTGSLDLDFANVPFQLRLQNCRLQEIFSLMRAEMSQLDLEGSLVQGISADGLTVRNNVFLTNGFTSEGEVRLPLAHIGGDLSCTAGRFNHEKSDALSLDRIDVKGIVFLSHGFIANGKVWLPAAQIGGDLDCEGGSFSNENGDALAADTINVKGNVFLRSGKTGDGKEALFTSTGQIILTGAQIGGQVDCTGGRFSNSGAVALLAERAIVKSSVFLTNGFAADGEVILRGVQIGGGFYCNDGNFQNATLDLTDASAATLFDSGLNDNEPETPKPTTWPRQGNLLLDGFTYGRIASFGKVNVMKRLDEWLALQPGSPFRSQPYLQLAKVLRESGDPEGAKKVLIEMEDRARRGEAFGPAIRPLLRWTIGYGHDPLRAFWWAAGLSAVGWIIYRRSYLAGSMVPTDKDARVDFKSPARRLPARYRHFSPAVYSLENSLPLVKLGQGDTWQPDTELQTEQERKRSVDEFAYQWARPWLIGMAILIVLLAMWGVLPSWFHSFATWVRSLDIKSLPELINRCKSLGKLIYRWKWRWIACVVLIVVVFAARKLIVKWLRSGWTWLSPRTTTPRFVMWFLWFQILLGWLLATLFVAGVSGIVHKE
jgi:hypothetical protein